MIRWRNAEAEALQKTARAAISARSREAGPPSDKRPGCRRWPFAGSSGDNAASFARPAARGPGFAGPCAGLNSRPAMCGSVLAWLTDDLSVHGTLASQLCAVE